MRAFESLNCYHLLNLDVASDVISVVKRTHIDFIFLDSDHEDIIEIISSLSDIKDTYVMLYAHSDISYFSRLFFVGLHGYLRKNASLEKAKEAFDTMCKSGYYIDDSLIELLESGKFVPEDGFFDVLSNREFQIFLMIVKYTYSNFDISKRLNLSYQAVSTFRSRIFKKIGVKNDQNLCFILSAMEHNLLSKESIDKILYSRN